MQTLFALVKWFFGLFLPPVAATPEQKAAESVITSHQEERLSDRNVTKIRDGDSKVMARPDGGITFNKFNQSRPPKCLWLFLLVLVGCSINTPSVPTVEVVYVPDRLPVYTLPAQPWLDDLTGDEIGVLTEPVKQKLMHQFDALIRWGESLQAILTGYNRFATERNAKNPLYKKLE